MVGLLTSLVYSVLQLFVGLLFSVASIFCGLKLFDAMTQGIEEWKEIRKGNLAVGLVMVSIILSLALVLSRPIYMIAGSFVPGYPMNEVLGSAVVGLAMLVLTLLISLVVIFFSLKIFDHLTTDVDETAELKKGNMAVAVIISGIILGVMMLIGVVIQSIVTTILMPPVSAFISGLFGIPSA
ncbi:MAG: DUF350 domain-containing protein [Candidatus Bilamarchaeaceae archaeon]